MTDHLVEDTLFDFGPVGTAGWPDRPRVLLSYAYASKFTADDFAAMSHMDVIIDSGAFTAYTTGKKIDHRAYLDWLLTHAASIPAAFSLDVVFDAEASMQNYLYGVGVVGDEIQLVPTWHIGSPWDMLNEYCSMTDYVAIGGGVRHYRDQPGLNRIAMRVHEVAALHGCRLHGLGMTGKKIMRKWPWHSVDSSSWTISARLPFLYLAALRGNLVSLNYGRPMPDDHQHLVRVYDGDPEGMEVEGWALKDAVGAEVAAARKQWGVRASARAYMYSEAASRWNGGAPDLRLYLAALPANIADIAAAHAAGNPWLRYAADNHLTLHQPTGTDPTP